MAQKEILVVGGAGFIGSHVNKMLHQAGYKTVVLDNLSTGDERAVPFGTFIKGDMEDTALLDEIFRNRPINAVMHFAAFIDVGESVRDPSKYYRNNVCNTLNLLQSMQRNDIKNFIFSSSAAIFGIPQQNLIKEDHPARPINPYGASKLMVEQILKDFDAAYGLRSCSLRYFNAAGGDPEFQIKNYKKKETNLIPILLKSLKYGDQTITINGSDYPTPDGTCVRDYIHICDLAEAHITALRQLLDGSPSSQFNLGNSRGYSVQEVVQAGGRITGIEPNISVGPRRAGDPPVLMADSTKARDELEWTPRYPDLETMIEHAWKAV